jgi:metal-responsive CopG/Arc/MetJ family transcriptional regulator
MTTQIAVRLPDELVGELDSLIAAGGDTSRSSVVEAALRRELRRRLWVLEVEKLIARGDTYEDLAGMHEFALGTQAQAD